MAAHDGFRARSGELVYINILPQQPPPELVGGEVGDAAELVERLGVDGAARSIPLVREAGATLTQEGYGDGLDRDERYGIWGGRVTPRPRRPRPRAT